jgi:replicative DNA helicase
MNARANVSEQEAFDGRAVAQLRVPPHSIESESAVLSGLLLDSRAWDRVGDMLAAGDFFRYEHRVIFAAIELLSNACKPVDSLTVYEHLQRTGEADQAGGLTYLNALGSYSPSAANIRRYAEIVRERSILRKLVTASDEIATAAFNTQGKTIDAIVDEAQQTICRIAETKGDDEWTDAYAGMIEHSALLERRHSGEVTAWPTGFSALDDYLEGGLRPGELVIVGARPSMGKTALGLSIGVNMATRQSVGVLSMEMSKSEVNDRLTAMLGRVSMSFVKRPARGVGLDWNRVTEGIDRARELRLNVNDQGGLTIAQVRSKARALKRAQGLDVLVVDYIGLMTGTDPKANRNAQLGEISRGLKSLSKELQIAVLCLAQLNRAAEERPEQMPQMSNLRDSGEIEQDADVILFIKRPIMANPELSAEWRDYARLSVAKNRQGRCGYIDLSYIGEQTRFSDWVGEAPIRKTVEKPLRERGMSR